MTSLNHSRLRATLFLILAFVVTRLLAFHAGLRYHIVEAPLLWQILDLDLLHHHLLRALFHLHGQPPLFNALVGVAEKLAGPHFGDLLVALQLVLGLATLLTVYAILLRLRVHPLLSLAAAAMLLFNPAAILFEFDPLYTELVFALHTFILYALVAFLQTRSRRALTAVFALAATLTLLRSSYQWIWLVALLALLLWQLPALRTRRTLLLGAAAIAVSLLWPLKNLYLVHHFASTTWGPFSLTKHWQTDRDTPPISGWIRDGLLPTFTHDPFESTALQQQWLRTRWAAPRTGYPELDDIQKATGGATNWNSLAMLNLLDAQAKDDSFLLRHDPKPYVVNITRGLRQYFEPTSQYILAQGGESAQQFRILTPADRLYRILCCSPLGLPPAESPTAPTTAALPPSHLTPVQALRKLCLGAILAFAIILVCLASFLRPTFWRTDPDRRIAAMAMILSILYVFSVVNLVEVNENMRFRFETESLVTMAVCLFLQQLWDHHRRTR